MTQYAYLRSLSETAGDDSVPTHILTHGRAFQSAELLPHEDAFADRILWDDCPMKECWRNSQLAALTLPPEPGITLRYVEGYVLPATSIPVEHAWLSVNGKVVDPTLRIVEQPYRRIRGVFPEGWEFWGVELLPEQCEHSQEHDTVGPLIDDYLCGWPLIPARYEKVKRRLAGRGAA